MMKMQGNTTEIDDGYTLSNSEFEAFNHLCSLSIKTVRGAVRNEAAKQYAKALCGHNEANGHGCDA